VEPFYFEFFGGLFMDVSDILDYYMEYEFLTRFKSSQLEEKEGTDYSIDVLKDIDKLKQQINKNKKQAVRKALKKEGCIKEKKKIK
jgi:hypothetical protein